MAWHAVFAHHVAHLQPTLTAGTEVAGYPYGNVRTLSINQRGKITANNPNGIKLDWNRGGSTGAAVNCILILSNTMSGGNWSVLSDDNSGFASPTTLINASTTIATDIYQRFDSSQTSSEQYIRFHYNTTTGAYQYGLISFGVAYQLADKGPQINEEGIVADPGSGPGQGFRRWTRSFRGRWITRANAETFLNYYSHEHINNSTNVRYDAIGGDGGRNPVALIDDSTSPATVWYGPARISKMEIAANYSHLDIEQDIVRRNILA